MCKKGSSFIPQETLWMTACAYLYIEGNNSSYGWLCAHLCIAFPRHSEGGKKPKRSEWYSAHFVFSEIVLGMIIVKPV